MNDLLHGLTVQNMLDNFPRAMQGDQTAEALAEITAKLLGIRPDEIQAVSIYPNIDTLPEELLDVLAYDFKVDWWDGDFSLAQKRRTLKDSWKVRRRLGTRYAVETALGNVFPGARVQEWFEYDGRPFCFRVTLPITEEGVTEERQRRILSKTWYYKNLRSHLDALELEAKTESAIRCGAITRLHAKVAVMPELVRGVEPQEAKVGVGAAGIYRERVTVRPELVRTVEASAAIAAAAHGATVVKTGSLPDLVKRVEAKAEAGTAGTIQQENVTRIWPGVTERVETRTGASGAWTHIHQTIIIQPEE